MRQHRFYLICLIIINLSGCAYTSKIPEQNRLYEGKVTGPVLAENREKGIAKLVNLGNEVKLTLKLNSGTCHGAFIFSEEQGYFSTVFSSAGSDFRELTFTGNFAKSKQCSKTYADNKQWQIIIKERLLLADYDITICHVDSCRYDLTGTMNAKNGSK